MRNGRLQEGEVHGVEKFNECFMVRTFQTQERSLHSIGFRYYERPPEVLCIEVQCALSGAR